MSEKKMTITEDHSKVIQSHWRKTVLESIWIIWTDHGDMILNLSNVFFLFWRPQDWNTQRTTWRLLQRDCGLAVRLLSAVVWGNSSTFVDLVLWLLSITANLSRLSWITTDNCLKFSAALLVCSKFSVGAEEVQDHSYRQGIPGWWSDAASLHLGGERYHQITLSSWFQFEVHFFNFSDWKQRFTYIFAAAPKKAWIFLILPSELNLSDGQGVTPRQSMILKRWKSHPWFAWRQGVSIAVTKTQIICAFFDVWWPQLCLILASQTHSVNPTLVFCFCVSLWIQQWLWICYPSSENHLSGGRIPPRLSFTFTTWSFSTCMTIGDSRWRGGWTADVKTSVYLYVDFSSLWFWSWFARNTRHHHHHHHHHHHAMTTYYQLTHATEMQQSVLRKRKVKLLEIAPRQKWNSSAMKKLVQVPEENALEKQSHQSGLCHVLKMFVYFLWHVIVYHSCCPFFHLTVFVFGWKETKRLYRFVFGKPGILRGCILHIFLNAPRFTRPKDFSFSRSW